MKSKTVAVMGVLAIIVVTLLGFLIAGDTYHRAIAASDLAGVLFFVAGFAGLATFVVFFRRFREIFRGRVRLFISIVVLGLTGGFLVLGGLLAAAATADLFSSPAVARGVVTAHRITTTNSGGTHGHSVSNIYDITVNGQSWSIGSDAYARFSVGTCVVLSYGPHTRIVTAVRACSRR